MGIASSPRAEPQAIQVLRDCLVQLRCLGLLLPPLGSESRHLLLEGLAVVLLGRRADVASGGEDVAALADLLQRRALAEAGDVGVALTLTLTLALSQGEGGFVGLAAPGVVGIGDAGDVLRGEVAGGCGRSCGPACGRR